MIHKVEQSHVIILFFVLILSLSGAREHTIYLRPVKVKYEKKIHVDNGHGKDYGNKHNPIHATNTISHEWLDDFVNFLVHYDVSSLTLSGVCV